MQPPCIGCIHEQDSKLSEPCATFCHLRHEYADWVEETYNFGPINPNPEDEFTDDILEDIPIRDILTLNIVGNIFCDLESILGAQCNAT